MNKEVVIREMNLAQKVGITQEFYVLDKHHYMLFWDKVVKKDNRLEILEEIDKNSSVIQPIPAKSFIDFKCIIVFAETDEQYKEKELLYSNNVDKIVCFYLVDYKNNIRYRHRGNWLLDYKYSKYRKKLDKMIL